MKNENKLVVVNKKKFFLKRVSFWIYFFVIANLLMFFAFTQDFFVQRYYSQAQTNFKSNNENYKTEYALITSQINKLDKTLNAKNADDCNNIANLSELKTLPTGTAVEINKLKSIIKVKEINRSLTEYYSYLEKTNNNFLQFNLYNQDLNKLIPFSSKFVNICINYDRLMTNNYYSNTDDFLMSRLVNQVNEIELKDINSNKYFSDIKDSIQTFKSKNYVITELFGASKTNLQKSTTKLEFATDVVNIVNSVQEFEKLVSYYQVVTVDNDNQLIKIKDDLVSSAVKVNNQNIVDSILKISF